MFAKPFLFAMNDHSDGISSIERFPNNLNLILSGSYDGEARLWHISTRATLWSNACHENFVTGIAVSKNGDHFLTCSTDKTIKMWKRCEDIREDELEGFAQGEVTNQYEKEVSSNIFLYPPPNI